VLRGSLVTLRAICKADLPRLCEFANTLEVRRPLSGVPPIPVSIDRLQADFDERLSRNGVAEGVTFAIVVDAIVIGQCSLSGLNQCGGVSRACDLSIGIGDRVYWGKGFGAEATKLLLFYAFRCWNMRRVSLQTSASNERAIRCYKSAGFSEEGRLRRSQWDGFNYVDTICMGILLEEWEELVRSKRNSFEFDPLAPVFPTVALNGAASSPQREGSGEDR
jgi:RimJ/RimL family protein N-acetyltransferase